VFERGGIKRGVVTPLRRPVTKRGKEFERGLRPLSLLLPSPAEKILGLFDVAGWRGEGGEASTDYQMQYNLYISS
jgi:hypothetical protein